MSRVGKCPHPYVACEQAGREEGVAAPGQEDGPSGLPPLLNGF